MTITTSALAYYARIGASLFPIPAGQKNPTGIVESFAHDHSADPAQWDKWAAENPGCNFGIVAGPSRLIIADVDVSEVGRDKAWAIWSEWWTSKNLPVPAPHVQSARGGWHTYFALPEGSPELRQIALIGPRDGSKKPIVDVRVANGFTVAAGSVYDDGGTLRPYLLMGEHAAHPAPAALIQHCTRAAPSRSNTAPIATRDIGDTAALIRWLAERDSFAAYEDWVGVGMALKLEFGDAGLDVWKLTHDETVDSNTEATKWQSFATEPQPGVQTLSTWLQRAHKLGWRGKVRESTASMFGQVAQMAAAAGATLSDQMPMMAGQQALTDEAAPILADFLANTKDAPLKPMGADCPALPPEFSSHGLFEPLRDCIDRILAMAETPKSWKATRVVDPLAVLSVAHAATFDAVCRRIRALGCTLPDSKIKLTAAALVDKVERAFVNNDAWHLDPRGTPEANNPDNVEVFLGIIGAEIRWNAWLERAEIRGGIGVTDAPREWPDWTYVDDAVIGKLLTRAGRTKTRFLPVENFFWRSLLSLARSHTFDPVLERIDELAAAWDGKPRLLTWLTIVCGVPCDPYHQSVGRNIVGGMVRRARHPGCKHDTMPVFFGFQGSGKSTLAAILADMGQSSLADIAIGKGRNFTDTVRFGDEAKELVLSLAGKLVAEIGEMGTRSGASAGAIKAMISRQSDNGRPAYARAVQDRPRRNIWFGTANEDTPLADPTGNRRFLPIRCDRELNLDWLHANVGQIVGEAARREAEGADFALPREVWAAAAVHQEAARSPSDIETMLTDWFAPSELAGRITYIVAADLVLLEKAAGLRNTTALRGSIMKGLGFKSENPRIGGKRTCVWVRGEFERIADIPRLGTRYAVATDGRPVVRMVGPSEVKQ